MKLKVQAPEKPSPCRLVFYGDGSFGQEEPVLFLDYEINLSHNGSLEVFASTETGVCYCLEGFSWKNFSKSKKGDLDLGTPIDGRLCFSLDEDDPIEWGTNLGKEFGLSMVDERKRLVLFGELPPKAEIVRFATDQFVCLRGKEIMGFIIVCPENVFEIGRTR